MTVENLKAAIRDVPDFPQPGIIFKDISPILGDPALFAETVDLFAGRVAGRNVTQIAGIDARGFIFGGAVARQLNLGFVPVRKKGKLPYKTFEQSYDLEYGSATIAIHTDAVAPGERVVLIDDLLATGGTARAAADLLVKAGAEVVEIQFLIELGFLNGREKLNRWDVFAPIVF